MGKLCLLLFEQDQYLERSGEEEANEIFHRYFFDENYTFCKKKLFYRSFRSEQLLKTLKSYKPSMIIEMSFFDLQFAGSWRG